MSDTVIKVDNLSKSYTISHKSNERYVALRDVITDKFKAIGSKLSLRNRASSNQHPASSSKEQFYALRDVSFEIKRGDRVGIIGRNGAGKSTLLKVLSRITEPTSGRIEITGRVASLLEVGTGFHPELTGRENIFLNGAILGMTKAEIKRKFDEIVDFAEIEKFLDTPVKRYSSGMYVRIAFAVAAHLEPEILIVDEVLAVGDAQFQKKCLGKMEEVGREGRTVLFVSHNMAAVQRLCSRAVMLSEGHVVADDDKGTVVERYHLDCSHAASSSRPFFAPESPYTNLAVTIDGRSQNGQHFWDPVKPLDLTMTIDCNKAMTCPMVDIAFFRLDGCKLFALQSYHLLDYNEDDRRNRWVLRFLLSNASLVPQTIYFDIGVRDRGGGYLIHWIRIAEIKVQDRDHLMKVTSDSLIWPDVRASIG